MSELYKFEDVKIKRIDSEKYDEDEFMIARMDFLGTNPNSHKLEWDDEVFCECCQTFLGKWVVAEVKDGDATTHTAKEMIVGQIPADQEIEFVRNEAGYIRAVVDVVLSKIYAKECCDIFENDDSRDVSVEIMCALDPEDENHVLAFKGVGVTILGRMTQPSSKGSNIKITRFSEEDVDSFYHNKNMNKANELEEFAIERRAKMAEKKSYKINKTELKEINWGDVDKAAMRDKIMEAKNRSTLVKTVYALVEDGWEEAPSEHLKYPLMAEIEGTFYYVREALSSALAYAKQHNEQAVIDKVEKLYKKFDLAYSGGKEETNMLDNEENVQVEELSETEEEISEIDLSEKNIEETVEETLEEQVEEENEEINFEAKCQELEAKCQEQAELIMSYEQELADLREFKAQIEESQKTLSVNEVLEKVKGHVDEDKYNEFALSAENYSFAELSAWKNNVFAYCGEHMINTSSEGEEGVHEEEFRMSTPTENEIPKTIWERLKQKYN